MDFCPLKYAEDSSMRIFSNELPALIPPYDEERISSYLSIASVVSFAFLTAMSDLLSSSIDAL